MRTRSRPFPVPRGGLRLLALAWLGMGGCSSDATNDDGNTGPVPLAGFVLSGDPASAAGATWTYQATVAGITYDLQGILFKPSGAGPFPAVIISHGNGGNVSAYSKTIAQTMVGWGLVCIATNYTHAGGVPIGAPGTAATPGASTANVQRALKLLDILTSLGYVDMDRVAAHGHSMGAFLTAALVGSDPGAFLVASHTAGGVRPDVVTGDAAAAPTEAQVITIRTPYSIHHGDQDATVPLGYDQHLGSILTSQGVEHELFVYPGAGHADVPYDPLVLSRVHAWYTAHHLF